jgi:hypothetical protein
MTKILQRSSKDPQKNANALSRSNKKKKHKPRAIIMDDSNLPNPYVDLEVDIVLDENCVVVVVVLRSGFILWRNPLLTWEIGYEDDSDTDGSARFGQESEIGVDTETETEVE